MGHGDSNLAFFLPLYVVVGHSRRRQEESIIVDPNRIIASTGNNSKLETKIRGSPFPK
jgi:hypothetical protein